MKIKKETKKPNPNRKESQINFRSGPETDQDLAFLQDRFPELSQGALIRACIASVAEDVKRKILRGEK